jgi:phosphate-transporting ATPase
MSIPRLRCENVYTAAGGPLNFALASGACVAIMGPSGVGKSLLLRALADLDPHRGEIFLDDTRQSACPPDAWRRQVQYVPAAAGWWAETVAEHFADFFACTPDVLALGLSAECGAWPVARLSSGERQRLSVLRAAALGSPVLLLDEPTANLDAESALAVERWLTARRASGVTSLWVTHDAAQAARVADRVLHLEHTGLVEAPHA